MRNALFEEFAALRPEAVVKRGGVVFVDAGDAPDLIDMARERGVAVLGLEGFLLDEDYVYPAISRIADFSRDRFVEDEGFVEWSANEALALLRGLWNRAPDSSHWEEEQMYSEAKGRYMLAITLHDVSSERE